LRTGRTCHDFTSRELGATKPDPAFFRTAAERLGAAPAECIMVGNDPVKDIAGARAAGMRTVWLAAPGSAPVPAPDRMITTLFDLPAAILTLEQEECCHG
jgi:FMN phosphatase YigB (HAD superfamily)